MRRGFLTGELLVSLTVLIPVMLVLIGVFPFAYSMDHRAADFIQAQEIARDQLESLRARPFADVSGYASTLRRGSVDYKLVVTVESWPPGQNPVRQKRVGVSVNWRAEHFLLSSLLYGWAL